MLTWGHGQRGAAAEATVPSAVGQIPERGRPTEWCSIFYTGPLKKNCWAGRFALHTAKYFFQERIVNFTKLSKLWGLFSEVPAWHLTIHILTCYSYFTNSKLKLVLKKKIETKSIFNVIIKTDFVQKHFEAVLKKWTWLLNFSYLPERTIFLKLHPSRLSCKNYSRLGPPIPHPFLGYLTFYHYNGWWLADYHFNHASYFFRVCLAELHAAPDKKITPLQIFLAKHTQLQQLHRGSAEKK
jgi:hypothetical protein